MSALTADACVILRAPFKVDKYGNTTSVRDWANATRTQCTRLSIQPDGTSEATGERVTVVTGWRLITARGVDFPAIPGDRVEFDGITAEIDGEIGRFRMAGRLHHCELRLKRVTG